MADPDGEGEAMTRLWDLSSSSDPRALAIVAGLGEWAHVGPHYSRRTPGSRTFTGVGQEIVLVRPDAVWAVVRSRVPAPRGSGASRGRDGETIIGRYVWRNMMYRNLGDFRSSTLIRAAVAETAVHWVDRYGDLPTEELQTEVRDTAVRSDVPGYCYRRAGWVTMKRSRGMTYLRCPRAQIERALR